MGESWIIEELFGQSEDPGTAWYDGHRIVRTHSFHTFGASRLTLAFESVDSEWPQGVHLEADSEMEINGIAGYRFVLWAHTAPRKVLVECAPGIDVVWVSNTWDPSGEGEPVLWVACAAMMAEELPNGYRYRCNDGFPDTDFNDIVFVLQREGPLRGDSMCDHSARYTARDPGDDVQCRPILRRW